MSATRSRVPFSPGGDLRPSGLDTRMETVDDTFREQRQELQVSLQEGWEAARRRFRELTNADLTAFRDGKEGVLANMEGLMSAGDRDIKKHQNHMAVVGKVLNCVEFVGGVAAQGASLVFGQANMCFSAIEMLINVPRMYKNLVDSLQELFEQVNEFFPKLKIFQRTDYNLGLDSALVHKLNEILISLVDLCGVAIKVRKHKALTIVKILFLKDDRVKSALTDFRNKIDQLDSLTTPVTLEKILEMRNLSLEQSRRLARIEVTGVETNENVKEVRTDVKEMSSGVKELLYFNIEGRNLREDQQKIEKIERALFVSKEAVAQSLRTLELCHESMLPGTIEILAEQECLQAKRRSRRPKPLWMNGDRGTGRTYYLAGLVQAISQRMPPFFTSESKAIWAYHTFGDRGISEGGKQSSPFRTALSLMACQIARQSSAYTRLLQKDLDDIHKAKDIKELLAKLRFRDLLQQENCELFLIFDGLDDLRGDLSKELNDVLELANLSGVWDEKRISTSCPQIVLVAKNETINMTSGLKYGRFEIISAETMNARLLEEFIEDQVEILREDSQKFLRRILISKVLATCDDSFIIAHQKLEIVRNAVVNDLDFDELLKQLETDGGPTISSQGERVLDEIFRRLSPSLRDQLKEILYWCHCGEFSVTTDLLECSLFLQRRKRPLESLKARIRRLFGGVVNVSNDNYVTISDRDVRVYVAQAMRSITSEAAKMRQSLAPKVQHTQDDSIRKLLHALGTSISTGDFSSIPDLSILQEGYEKPVFSSVDGHWLIAVRCLQALNDDRIRDHMQPLIAYAGGYLPEHLSVLADSIGQLEPYQRRALGQALTNFLSDVDCIEAAMEKADFYPYAWTSRLKVEAIGTILAYETIQDELEPRDRRMANRLITWKDPDSLPFLESLALAAGSLWLDEAKKTKWGPGSLYAIVSNYLGVISDGILNLRIRSRDVSARSSRSGSVVAYGVSRGRRRPSTVRSARSKKRFSSVGSSRDDRSMSATDTPLAARNENELRDTDNTHDTNAHAAVSERVGDPVCRPASLGPAATSVFDPSLPDEIGLEKSADSGIVPPASPPPDRGVLGNPQNVAVSEPDRDKPSIATGTGDFVRPFRSPSRSDTSEEDPEQRLNAAVDWVLKKRGLVENHHVLLRSAEAVKESDPDLYLTYLKKAFESSEEADILVKHTTAATLASAYARDKKWDKAHEILLPMSEELRQKFTSNPDSNELREAFCAVLDQMSAYRGLDNQIGKAIELLCEVMKWPPTADHSQYHLIRLLCMTKQIEAAQAVFEAWAKSAPESGKSGPGHFLTFDLRNAGDLPTEDLTRVFISARGQPLLKSFEQSISAAIEEAQAKARLEDEFLLHFARGLLFAVSRDTGATIDAIRSWSRCMAIAPNTDLDPNDVSDLCKKYLAQLHFDHSRMQVKTTPHSRKEERELFGVTADQIKEVLAFDRQFFFVIHSPMTFSVSASIIAGDLEIARELLKDDVAYAIELLTDEDDENDERGLWTLCRTMLLIRNYEACHCAFSFFGRSPRQTELDAQPSPIVDAGTNLDSSGEPSQNANILDENSNAMEETSQPKNDRPPNIDGVMMCSGCDSSINAKDDNEIWTCKYCNAVDFCAPCYEKLKNDQLEIFVCNPNHDHLLLKHFDYDTKEIEGENVWIGWKFEQGDDPRDRRRVGEGRIVSRKEWMSILGEEWGITSAGSDSDDSYILRQRRRRARRRYRRRSS